MNLQVMSRSADCQVVYQLTAFFFFNFLDETQTNKVTEEESLAN